MNNNPIKLSSSQHKVLKLVAVAGKKVSDVRSYQDRYSGKDIFRLDQEDKIRRNQLTSIKRQLKQHQLDRSGSYIPLPELFDISEHLQLKQHKQHTLPQEFNRNLFLSQYPPSNKMAPKKSKKVRIQEDEDEPEDYDEPKDEDEQPHIETFDQVVGVEGPGCVPGTNVKYDLLARLVFTDKSMVAISGVPLSVTAAFVPRGIVKKGEASSIMIVNVPLHGSVEGLDILLVEPAYLVKRMYLMVTLPTSPQALISLADSSVEMMMGQAQRFGTNFQAIETATGVLTTKIAKFGARRAVLCIELPSPCTTGASIHLQARLEEDMGDQYVTAEVLEKGASFLSKIFGKRAQTIYGVSYTLLANSEEDLEHKETADPFDARLKRLQSRLNGGDEQVNCADEDAALVQKMEKLAVDGKICCLKCHIFALHVQF